jgi:hypothetical protein
MRARHFWRAVTVDNVDVLDRFLTVLESAGVRYCVIGGQGVNADVDPLVSLDLDIAVAAPDLVGPERLLSESFRVERIPHSLNVSLRGSDLRIQVQTDERYAPFVDRAVQREVLGLTLPVAAIEDILIREGLGRARPDSTRQQAPTRSRRHRAAARSVSGSRAADTGRRARPAGVNLSA